MRYKRRAGSEMDLVRAADQFLAEGVKYSLGSLFMIGFLLVGDRRIGTKIPVPAKALMAYICGLVAEAIDNKTQNGVKSMTCSQLVYEIYDKAGHTLHMDKFLLDTSSRDRGLPGQAAEGPNLLEQALASAQALDTSESTSGRRAAGLAQAAAFSWVKNRAAAWADKHKYEVFDYLCGVLLKWLRGRGEGPVSRGAAGTPATDGAELFDSHSPIDEVELREFLQHLGAGGDFSSGLMEDVGQFALLVQDVAEDAPASETGPLNRGIGDWSGRLEKALAHLKKIYSHYVTPEDLFNNCPELTEIVRLN